MSLMIEMFREFKQDMNSRFIEMKKDLEEFKEQAKMSGERLDGLQQQLSHLALEKSEQGVKTGERGGHAVTDEGNRDTSSPQQRQQPLSTPSAQPLQPQELLLRPSEQPYLAPPSTSYRPLLHRPLPHQQTPRH